MARQREFDTEAALDAVMTVFWRHGYEASSLAMLESASGVGRGSLYAAFGDKRGLFLAALGRYEQRIVASKLEVLSDATDPLGALERFFDDVVHFSIEDGRGMGCMLTNAVTEMAPREAELATALAAAQEHVRKVFQGCLEQARSKGQMEDSGSPQALASFLSTVLFGLRVAARLQADRQQLEDSAAIAMTAVYTAAGHPRRHSTKKGGRNNGMS